MQKNKRIIFQQCFSFVCFVLLLLLLLESHGNGSYVGMELTTLGPRPFRCIMNLQHSAAKLAQMPSLFVFRYFRTAKNCLYFYCALQRLFLFFAPCNSFFAVLFFQFSAMWNNQRIGPN